LKPQQSSLSVQTSPTTRQRGGPRRQRASFSVVEGATQLNGQAISFLRNVFCNGANVPSWDAALYDNAGLAPDKGRRAAPR